MYIQYPELPKGLRKLWREEWSVKMNNYENQKLRDTLNKAGELVYDVGVLKELRANKIDVAIELLEHAVDDKVSAIGRQL